MEDQTAIDQSEPELKCRVVGEVFAKSINKCVFAAAGAGTSSLLLIVEFSKAILLG